MTEQTLLTIEATAVAHDMTEQEARTVVESIRTDLGSLRSRVYSLWARKGWKAMGYETWDGFCAGEFPELSDRSLRGYVNAEQVQRLVSPRTGTMVPELPERVLRPLVQFKDDPKTLKALWAEAMSRKPDTRDYPAASLVEAVVAEHKHKQDELAWPDDQMRRRLIVEAGGTVVANRKADSGDQVLLQWAAENDRLVNIDRSSAFGNPYVLGEDGDRDTVCDSFEIYFGRKYSLHDRVLGLKGKVLGCWCYPQRCHGDHLVALLQQEGTNADF